MGAEFECRTEPRWKPGLEVRKKDETVGIWNHATCCREYRITQTEQNYLQDRQWIATLKRAAEVENQALHA